MIHPVGEELPSIGRVAGSVPDEERFAESIEVLCHGSWILSEGFVAFVSSIDVMPADGAGVFVRFVSVEPIAFDPVP